MGLERDHKRKEKIGFSPLFFCTRRPTFSFALGPANYVAGPDWRFPNVTGKMIGEQ